MSLITRIIFIIVLTVYSTVKAQTENKNTNSDKWNENRFMALDISYNYGIPGANQLYSNNLENGSGISFNAQYYFKKHFYAGLGAGFTTYTVKNGDLLGSYNRTSKIDAVLFAGAHIELLSIIDLGMETGLGLSSFNNNQGDSEGNRRFQDSGNFFLIALPLDIKLNENLHFIVRPRYDFVNLNITAPREIQGDLERATFFNINIGLRFVIY